LSPELFAVTVIVGAALLAAWFVARFPRLAPEGGRWLLIHACGSAVIMYLLIPVIRPYLHALMERRAATWVTIFLFILPALVYRFVSAIWILRWLQSVAGSRFR
jgi:hypothetical protein